MRVALVKQALDIFGPWSSIRWDHTSPKNLFAIWPGKATYWEMTCLLQADWYIIPQKLETDYIRDAVLKYPERTEAISKYTTNIIDPQDIPFDQYDVVITTDPILMVPQASSTLYAYYLQEHWDILYQESLRQPVAGYDLFLDHMMVPEPFLESLPQAVSFPYLRAPEVMRFTFNSTKEEAVWIDWRTLTFLGVTTRTLAKGGAAMWNDAAAASAASRLERLLKLPVRYRGEVYRQSYGFSDPPQWDDARCYLEAMGQCKYYVAIGNNIGGAGQGLCDAASLGCICIGQMDKIYHRLVCHPACLCIDIVEMPRKLRTVVSSSALQEEVLDWQDKALRTKFIEAPLTVLEGAVAMKGKHARPGNIRESSCGTRARVLEPPSL